MRPREEETASLLPPPWDIAIVEIFPSTKESENTANALGQPHRQIFNKQPDSDNVAKLDVRAVELELTLSRDVPLISERTVRWELFNQP